MYLAAVEGVRLPAPTLSGLEDWRRQRHALIHLVVAGRDSEINEDQPAPRTESRIPKIGAATRIMLAHNPSLAGFGLWTVTYLPVTYWIEILSINLLQLEHDCMHLEHARPSDWRHAHEHVLVELLSRRFDLVIALLGYRHWPLSAREQFIRWHIQPAITTKH